MFCARSENQLRFDDTKGGEHVLLNAERNRDIAVETHWDGHDTKFIGTMKPPS
ncbi:bacteriophage T4 gp5 trimerisation domain-containing protein [Caballeronia sp. LZ003]|uniref:bacteriophage T4 gp5 trimerisation domain-containing protein n=1 Tax=unclassified Caballeronia TaxID=2646786 RepID=UPI003857BFE5